jgi:hypothetical protein
MTNADYALATGCKQAVTFSICASGFTSRRLHYLSFVLTPLPQILSLHLRFYGRGTPFSLLTVSYYTCS